MKIRKDRPTIGAHAALFFAAFAAVSTIHAQNGPNGNAGSKTTQNVNVVNTPTVNVGTKPAVTLARTPDVTLSNAQPVVIRDSDERARRAFQFRSSIQILSGSSSTEAADLYSGVVGLHMYGDPNTNSRGSCRERSC